MFEAKTVLYLWLGIVPEHTVTFFRLSMIGTMVTALGQTGVTACMATGKIKTYTIVMGLLSALVFPFTWILYLGGAPVESTYLIFIIIYLACDIIRLFFLKKMIGFPPKKWIVDVFSLCLLVSCFGILIPYICYALLESSLAKTILIIFVCIISSFISIWFLGLKNREKNYIANLIRTRIPLKKRK